MSLADTGATPPGQQAALTSALTSLGTTMVAKLGTNPQVGTVSDVSLNGLTGVVVPYAVTVSGHPVVGWLYLLTAAGHIYALNAGATAASWSTYRPIFARAIASFRARYGAGARRSSPALIAGARRARSALVRQADARCLSA